MADRNFQKKKRNDVKRKRKPVMIFTGEGKNKTEKQYFLSFQEQHGKYSIQFVNTGFDTDPAGILRPRLQEADKNVKKLMAHYASIGVKWGEVDCNPMTDVTESLKELDVI